MAGLTRAELTLADFVRFELEVEVEGDETELEVELKWYGLDSGHRDLGGGRSPVDESGHPRDASGVRRVRSSQRLRCR